MDAINAIAKKTNLVLSKMRAKALVQNTKAKNHVILSTIGCTSFFPSQTSGCYGDGGAVFCNDV